MSATWKMALLAGLVLSACSTRDLNRNSQSVQCNGVWSREIQNARKLVPVGDGKFAWTWNEDSVNVVDSFGNTRNGIKLPASPNVPNGDERGVQVYSAFDGHHAWVYRDDGRLFYVDVDGNVQELSINSNPLGLDRMDMTWTGNDGKQLWVLPSRPTGVAVINQGVSLKWIRLDTMNEFVGSRQVRRTSTDTRAWVILGLSKRIDASERWSNHSLVYLVDAGGSSWEFAHRVHPAVRHSPLFSGHGEFCWLFPAAEGLYGIREDGSILNGGKPFLEHAKLESMVASDDGNHIWVRPRGNGFYVMEKDGAFAVKKQPIMPSQTVVQIFPVGNRHALVATRGSQIYLADSDGRIAQISSSLLQRARIRGAVATPDENNFWVVSQDNRVYVLRPDATLANGGKPIDDATTFTFWRNENSYDEGLASSQEESVDSSIHPLDNSRALVVSERSLWVVSIEGEQTRIEIPSGIGQIESVFASREPSGSRYYWLTTKNSRIFAINRDGGVFGTGTTGPSFVDFGRLYPHASGKQAWTTGGEDSGGRPLDRPHAMGIVESLNDLTDVTLTFGPERMSPMESNKLSLSSHGPVVLSADPQGSPWEMQFICPWQEPNDNTYGTVDINVLRGGTQVAHAVANVRDRQLSPTWEKSVEWDSPYEVTLTYSDGYGSRFSITWSNVSFSIPWWQRRKVRTLIAFVIVLLVVITLVRSKVPQSSLVRWLPAVFWIISAGLVNLRSIQSSLNIDGSLFVVLLVISTLVAIPVGLVSPPVFRELARAEPFLSIAPYALLVPSIRGRVFSDYAKWLGTQLERHKEAAYQETYVSVVAGFRLSWDPASTREIGNPAEMLRDAICAGTPENSATTLIQSPGGRGKSALLREIIRLALTSFLQDPRLPLPVLCDARGEGLDKLPAKTAFENLVASALGRFLIAPDSIDSQLRSGFFFIGIDGLSESCLTASQIREYAVSDYGIPTRLLLTTRPHVEYLHAVSAFDRFVVVEPKRLDEKTLEVFEEAYLQADLQSTETPRTHLSKELRQACRGPDGTYLPILVRFAIRLRESSIRNVADLYDATFIQLLKGRLRDDSDLQLFDDAKSLCIETYWKDGYRTVPYSGAVAARKATLEKLLKAGIVIPADESRGVLNDQPKQVRFFHDSMQSFLTARGLFTVSEKDGSWIVLQRAAGDPTFVKAQSDLLSSGGSELFQMCLEVFLPKDKLLEVLRSQLLDWAVNHDGDLRKNDVLSALPDDIQKLLEKSIDPQDGAGATLSKAVEICVQGYDESALQNLAMAYSRIAPIVWPYLTPSKEKADF